jgi:hypothetical protein
MPEGDSKLRSQPPTFASGWKFGEPDAVFGAEADYKLGAEGADVYRCFVIPTSYAEDRWVSSLEVQPGNRGVVHHVIAYLDKSGRAREADEKDAGPGYTSFGGPGFRPSGTLGGWAPGNEPRLLPAGMGMLLPKGADIVLQVHYHRSGKPEVDRTRIGLTFAKGAVDKRMRVVPILYLPLRIPMAIVHGNPGGFPSWGCCGTPEFITEARAQGDSVELVAIPGAGHFESPDPTNPVAGPAIRRIVRSMLGLRTR